MFGWDEWVIWGGGVILIVRGLPKSYKWYLAAILLTSGS
jgi:hypothetical protein